MSAQCETLDIFASFMSRVREVPHSPPEGFDPLTADAEQLARFLIPPRPAPDAPGYAFWRRLHAPPLVYAEKPFVGLGDMTLGYARAEPPAGRGEGSSNWSGVYISARDGEGFVAVQGSWIVPVPRPRPDAAAGETFNSSTWIGLDGQRRYFNSSLPQIGTEQKVKVVGGVADAECTTWMQWWSRDLEENRPIKLSVDARPGDEILCSIVVDDPFTATFTLRNVSTGAAIVKARIASPEAVPPGGTTKVPLRITGATAEWITELPGDPDGLETWRLPDYGTVLFERCLAASAPAPGLPARSRDLAGAQLIAMHETRRDPSRTARISVPTRVGTRHAATSYLHVP